jgi:hypothetical protein
MEDQEDNAFLLGLRIKEKGKNPSYLDGGPIGQHHLGSYVNIYE